MAKKVINIIEENLGTAHSPLKVLAEDFKLYYLKTPKALNPELDIIKEFLCSQLLPNWNLKTPNASILEVDKSIIDFDLSPHHKNEFFERSCFGSEQVENSQEFNQLLSIDNKHDFNRFVNPDDILKIGLFDIWVENDDRKPTNPNLLLHDSYNGFEIYAIDHAFTYSSMAFKDLNPKFAPAVSPNDSILETEFAKKVYKILIKENENWLVEIQDYFYFVIDKCRVNFEDVISGVPTDLGFTQNCIDSLYNFLFSESRNKKVLSEFRRRFIK